LYPPVGPRQRRAPEGPATRQPPSRLRPRCLRLPERSQREGFGVVPQVSNAASPQSASEGADGRSHAAWPVWSAPCEPPHRGNHPYLGQHADNPVDWFPWGSEACAAAAELDRPTPCRWATPHALQEALGLT